MKAAHQAARRFRPVVLCILDGWGHRDQAEDNAIALAETPVWDDLWARCPHGLLEASNADVGLPDGQMGNSEVGHMNLGAGRVVPQTLPRIDRAVADGSLAANPELVAFTESLAANGGTCHLLGLVSPGGVHSHQDHIAALARMVAARGVPVALHAVLDGRDTPPESARGYLAALAAETADIDDLATATVTGRYYAMDRDRRWDRVGRAYQAIAAGAGEAADTADAAVAAAYGRGESDEFVAPTVVGGYAGMADGDGLLVANFRADRLRQILAALLDPGFDGFERSRRAELGAACGMIEYSDHLNRFLGVLFPTLPLSGILGQVVADAGLRQLRIAETEKYAHVTFFFNGGEERLFAGEERILVPSPRVATYDLEPAMSAVEVTDRLVGAIEGGDFDLVVVNYANGDMVGHSGKLDATMRAAEAVDACLGRLAAAVEGAGGALVITADHGNAETMRDGHAAQPHTAHTSNPVPFIVCGIVGDGAGGAAAGGAGLRHGRLADVAPTLLELLGLPCPEEMTGTSLLGPSGNLSARRRAQG